MSVIDALPWQRFICRLQQYFDCDVAGLSFGEPHTGLPPASVWVSRAFRTDEALERAAIHRKQYSHLDPLAIALTQSEDILILDEVVDRRAFQRTEYYREFVQKYPLEYQIAVRLAVRNGPACQLALCNGADERNFDYSDKERLRELLPHLKNALEIHAELQTARRCANIYSKTLSLLAVGTIILDMRGTVLQMNQAAQDMIQQGAGLTLINRRPSPIDPCKRYELRRMIAAAVAWVESHRSRDFVDVLSLGRYFGVHIGVVVRSVPIIDQLLDDTRPRAIIHINGISEAAELECAIASLFGLTPSEALLAARLSEGLTIREAAIELGLSESSARTYTKRIFAKTGTNRQVELVRLMLKSVTPLCRQTASVEHRLSSV